MIHFPKDLMTISGEFWVVTRCPFTKQVLKKQYYQNYNFSSYRSALVKDIAKRTTNNSIIKALSFTRDEIEFTPGVTPDLSSLTNEFRAAVQIFNSNTSLQINGNLATNEGNGSGNIRACGFVFGESATTIPGTGTLGSVIKDMSIEKTSSVELSFTYILNFGSL